MKKGWRTVLMTVLWLAGIMLAPASAAVNGDISSVITSSTGENGKPAAPSNLAATAQSPLSIALTWQDNSNNEVVFYLERQEAGTSDWITFSIPANTQSYIDTKYLKANTTYLYRISAGGGVYASDYSNTCTVTTPAAVQTPAKPAAPSNLQGVAQSATSVLLTWKDNSSDEKQFYLERQEAGTTDWITFFLPANTESYVDSKYVKAGTTYNYRICAAGGTYTSDYSNTCIVATPAQTQEPQGPQNPQYTGTEIILTVGSTSYSVNGQGMTLDAPPVMQNDRVLLPIRYVVEALGGTMDWNDGDQSVVIHCNGHVISLWIDQTHAVVDGADQTMDVPPAIINGRTMVPVRFVSENLGCQVLWDAKWQQVTIRYPASN